MMEKLYTFIERLEKIDIKVELVANYPWIYLDKVNGSKVKEVFEAEHGFTIAFSPIKLKEDKVKFTDLKTIFQTLRKYK